MHGGSKALCKVKYMYIKPKIYTKVCCKKSPIIISPPPQASDIYVLAQVPLDDAKGPLSCGSSFVFA